MSDLQEILNNAVKLYIKFFQHSSDIWKKHPKVTKELGLKNKDHPSIDMYQMEAFGLFPDNDYRSKVYLNFLDVLRKKWGEVGDDKFKSGLEERVDINLKQRAFSRAFFAYSLRYLIEGNTMGEIAQMAADHFRKKGFMLAGEYVIHKIHPDKIGSNAIFLDFDDTITTGNGIRKNLYEFLKNITSREDSFVAVTTAGFLSELKFKKEAPDIFQYVDAAYTVPSIIEIENNENYQRIPNIKRKAGKLYTDICQRLEIHHDNAIIITDSYLDRSAEVDLPIVTLVTGPGTPANYWDDAYKAFQILGDGDIMRGSVKLIDMPNIPGNQGFKILSPARNVLIAFREDLPNAYFLNHLPDERTLT